MNTAARTMQQTTKPDHFLLSVEERSILARFAGRTRRAVKRSASHGAFLVV